MKKLVKFTVLKIILTVVYKGRNICHGILFLLTMVSLSPRMQFFFCLMARLLEVPLYRDSQAGEQITRSAINRASEINANRGGAGAR